MKSFLSIFAIILGLGGASAVAQSNPLKSVNAPSPTYTSVGVADLQAILASEGVTSKGVAVGEEVYLQAELVAGKTFWLYARDCQNAAAQTGCGVVEIFAVMPGGLSYEAINAYHLSQSQSAIVMRRSDGKTLVTTKSYIMGGVTRNNILVDVATFLADADRVSGLPRSQQPVQVRAEPKDMLRGSVLAKGDSPVDRLISAGVAVDAEPSDRPFLMGRITRYLTLDLASQSE